MARFSLEWRLAVLLVATARAAAIHGHKESPLAPLGHESIVTVPMRLYRHDCGRTGHPSALMQVDAPGPGAGMGAVTPFQEVLKDGFYEVDCVKDYMLEHGDKFGDGKFAYEIEDKAGVTIVHYSLVVKTEDQEPMTPDVCFKFCRTVPDMMFFGLTHGRECYCAPYFKAMAGDSSSCDAVCDGDNTLVCGGMSKSSIFQMHECSDAKENVAAAAVKLTAVGDELTKSATAAKHAQEVLDTSAADLQTAFGKVGDSAATELLQSAKVFAGRIQEKVDASAKLDIATLATEATATASGGAVDSFEATSEAEDLTARIETAVAKGATFVEELEALTAKAAPEAGSNASASLYYPVMYFVDKEFGDVPSTCGGTSAGEPSYGSFATCASSCDAAVGSCVGFSFIAKEIAPSNDLPGSEGLCFLFSKLLSATYYTGCGGGTKFLQKGHLRIHASQKRTMAAVDTKCVAKFEDFEGVSLKPDASGKCEKCLESVTKADRCFE